MNLFPSQNKNYAIYPSVEKINGWLNKPAAYATFDILNWQSKSNIKGGILEIGVFCGKYFSILAESAIKDCSPILGIDTFQYAPQERVIEELTKIFGKSVEKTVRLMKNTSAAVSPSDIKELIGECRFVSIDGSHDFEDVFLDLTLSEKIISATGLVAVDDFLNPLTLGVNQAVNHFFAQPRFLSPVAYTANKLFLAHRASAEDYRISFEGIFESGEEPFEINFRKKRKLGRHHIEQNFFGSRLLVR